MNNRDSGSAHATILRPPHPMNHTVKHAVLRVRFASATADCDDTNSQPIAPGEALLRLREGDSWAALLSSGHDVRELTDWLMLLRHQPGGRLPGVLALLPDVADPGALAALRAGADAVLHLGSTAALIRAQLGRLRERVAPQPDGWLQLDDDLALDGQARRLYLSAPSSPQADSPKGGQGHFGAALQSLEGTQTLALPPQLFHLLWTLAAQAGHVLGPQALRLAMDIPARAQADTVHTAVGRLRRALRPLGLHNHVQTVHGVGYRWHRTLPPGQTTPSVDNAAHRQT
ncbi:putative transcriptional regulatory protein [Thiomonas sp. X19]|uniref:helix-turn-helix domain-containing protein n=1 Tax=Thiomonas sp. X19 TaxID=1050370 RepID=UPI000B684DC1|nr:helix-turn-helix domain-containing protein [Thiomonas sp. X19]SCC92006.1 putative transcriptional regulatory protein [Thiomonas sp. X19]